MSDGLTTQSQQGAAFLAGLPDPLTPTDCDLRGLPFMPLDVVRLLDSDLFILSTGEEFKAAVALWCKSWTQVPAGSLPDDDRILSHLSGAGTGWCDMSRDMVLRGWTKCSDGRLYHPVVAEKALEALPRRRDFLDKKTGEAERKARERADRKSLFAALKSAGIPCEFNIKTAELRSLAERHKVTNSAVTDVTPVTRDSHGHVTAKTGTGTGTGTLKNTAKAVGTAERGARLPDDFVMAADWKDYARGKGHSSAVIEVEAEKFTLHWQAETGRTATKRDWKRAWQKWVLGVRPGRNMTASGEEYLGV